MVETMLQCAEQIYGAHYPMLGLQKLKGKGQKPKSDPKPSIFEFWSENSFIHDPGIGLDRYRVANIVHVRPPLWTLLFYDIIRVNYLL